MGLRLAIENETNLPDGGPVTFTITGKRTVDIGRDQHLDWTLPDPSRFVSGKHCEVRYKDGGYWLHDVSTNGTYLNGAEERMRGPHQLRSGDRFIVGHYIIAAALDADAFEARAAAAANADAAEPSYSELWRNDGSAAPPIDPKQLRVSSEIAHPAKAEFLDWAASVPHAQPVKQSLSTHLGQPVPRPSEPSDDPWGFEPALTVDYLPPPATPFPPSEAASETPAAAFNEKPPSGREAAAQPAKLTSQDEPAAPVQMSPFLSPSHTKAQQWPLPVSSGPAFEQPALSVSDDGTATEDFLRMFATAAGLPADMFADTDRREAAQQIGKALRLAVEGAMQLLKARNQAKQIARSTSQTTIEATGNNPLKFSPTPEDALRIMFTSRSESYLDAEAALTQTFHDLRSHQLKTYAALQHAVSRLVSAIDPAIIARDLEQNGGKSLLTSKKAKLWDDYRARWDAQMLPDSGGPIAAFMLHFADYYDSADNPGS